MVVVANRAETMARNARRRPLVTRLARSGLVARAAVYVLLAYLTVRLAAARPSLQRFVVALPDRRLPSWVGPALRVVGTYGNVARGAAFAAVGATLATAAVADRARDAKGLGSALASLTHQPAGRPLLAVAALGFLAFAAMSALEAAYREL